MMGVGKLGVEEGEMGKGDIGDREMKMVDEGVLNFVVGVYG